MFCHSVLVMFLLSCFTAMREMCRMASEGKKDFRKKKCLKLTKKSKIVCFGFFGFLVLFFAGLLFHKSTFWGWSQQNCLCRFFAVPNDCSASICRNPQIKQFSPYKCYQASPSLILEKMYQPYRLPKYETFLEMLSVAAGMISVRSESFKSM